MRVLRATTVLIGAAILVFGVYGLLSSTEIPDPQDVGKWLVGGVALHDFVLAPLVFGLCWLAARRTPPRVRTGLAAVLMIVGTATLVAAPILLHGRVAIR